MNLNDMSFVFVVCCHVICTTEGALRRRNCACEGSGVEVFVVELDQVKYYHSRTERSAMGAYCIIYVHKSAHHFARCDAQAYY